VPLLQEKQLYVQFDQIKGWVSKIIGPPSLVPKMSAFHGKQKKEDDPELRQVHLCACMILSKTFHCLVAPILLFASTRFPHPCHCLPPESALQLRSALQLGGFAVLNPPSTEESLRHADHVRDQWQLQTWGGAGHDGTQWLFQDVCPFCHWWEDPRVSPASHTALGFAGCLQPKGVTRRFTAHVVPPQALYFACHVRLPPRRCAQALH